MRQLFWVVAALAWVLLGCRDLSYQEPGSENAGPRVEFVGLPRDATVPLRHRVDLRVEDADGVTLASLGCAGSENGPFQPLFSWTGAPYSAEVEFTSCFAAAGDGGVPDGTPVFLQATAQDAAGAVGTAVIGIKVNARLPALVDDLPPRVRPGAAVTVTLTSDVPLAAPPSLLVDGVPAQVTGSGQSFAASFVAPGVGADLSPGRTSGDLATLEALTRSVRASFSAVGQNGNRLSYDRELVVSRVLWERPVPGALHFPTEAETSDGVPVSTGEGLWVALRPENPQAGGWTPGFFREAGGDFSAPAVGAFRGRGLSPDGTAVVVSPDNMQLRRITPGDEVATANGNLPPGELVRFPNQTCVTTDNRDPFGMCVFGGRTFLRCFGPGATLQDTTAPTWANNTEGGEPDVVATSGTTAVALQLNPPPTCGGQDLQNAVFSTPTASTYVALGAGELSGVERVLPVGDTGTFVVAYVTPVGLWKARQLSASGWGASYAVPAKSTLLAARPDGAVISQEAAVANTTLSLYPPAGAPQSTTLPGRFEIVHPGGPWYLPINAVPLPDNRFAYLARTHDLGRAVVALDAELKPRWIYRYPRGTNHAYLVGDSATGELYLVDVTNSYVVALSREW